VFFCATEKIEVVSTSHHHVAWGQDSGDSRVRFRIVMLYLFLLIKLTAKVILVEKIIIRLIIEKIIEKIKILLFLTGSPVREN
jgi:hypothetical protein